MRVSKMMRAVAGVVVAMATVAGLGACSMASPVPTDAASLVEQAQKVAANNDSFHLDVEASADMLFMQVSATASEDVVGDQAHGTATMAAFGTDMEAEFYIDEDGDLYSGLVGEDETLWTVQRAAIESDMTMGEMLQEVMDVDGLDTSEFSATEDGYELAVTGDVATEVLAKLAGVDVLDVLPDVAEDESVTVDECRLTFDKDCRLVGYDVKVTTSSGDFTASAKMSAKISRHGEVSVSDVAVPDEVVSAAVEDTDEYGYDDDVYFPDDVEFDDELDDWGFDDDATDSDGMGDVVSDYDFDTTVAEPGL